MKKYKKFNGKRFKFFNTHDNWKHLEERAIVMKRHNEIKNYRIVPDLQGRFSLYVYGRKG